MSSTVQQNLQILKDRLWKFSNPLEKFFENLGKSQIVRHFKKNTLNTSCKFYKHFYRHFPILPRHSRCFLHTSKLYLYTHKMLCTHFFIKNTANNLGHFPNTLQNILDILWKISKHLQNTLKHVSIPFQIFSENLANTSKTLTTHIPNIQKILWAHSRNTVETF